MIIRIVKLTITPSKSNDFITLFKNNKNLIESYKGCLKVELLQDKKYDNIFFTYSHWEKETFLENYRHSAVFSKIWKEVKPMFCGKPKAWSTKCIV